MADQGVLRALRASVFALVCVLLATAGHTIAAGALPPLIGLVAGLPLVALLSVRLIGRERSFRAISLTVIGSQLGLHTLFDYADGIPARAHEQAHHAVAASGHAGESMTPAMAAAHVVAGLAAAWWLRRGEAALWSLASAVVLPLLALCRGVVVATPAAFAVAPFAVPEPVLRAAQLRHSVTRRGPPAVLLAS
jgi:hypothetical protein